MKGHPEVLESGWGPRHIHHRTKANPTAILRDLRNALLGVYLG